jgi:hypothetical protein
MSRFCRSTLRRDPLEGFELSGEVVGGKKAIQMYTQLHMAVVVEAFHRCIFDRTVHSLDLSIRPGVTHFRLSVIYPIFFAAHAKHM